MAFPQARPLAIAHRAGNHLNLLRAAEERGADGIEADVWLHRGRIEVRHGRTMGPLPLLWDHSKLTSAWASRPQLADLLSAAAPHTRLMLDLKGSDPRLPAAVMEEMRRYWPSGQFMVCSQNWALVEPFWDVAGVRVLHSVGNSGHLRDVTRRLRGRADGGISIHQKLLTPAVVEMLHDVASVIVTWCVNDEARRDELHDWGVDGFITDNLALLEDIVGQRRKSVPA